VKPEAELLTISSYGGIEPLLNVNPTNDITGPIAKSVDAPPTEALSDISSSEKIISTYAEPSHSPTSTNPPLPIIGKRPAKRFRVREDITDARCGSESTSGRCPGDKGQGQCSVDSKKRWGQRHIFKKHFVDKHMSTYKVKGAGYHCDCGETFPKTEDGRGAFAEHKWANFRTVG
jgi:hypothetical protein